MTLLELLVEKLPEHGGWPEGAAYAFQSEVDVEVYFFTKDNDRLTKCDKAWYFQESDTRGLANIITREQYEAALAASQQPAWSGEGLPPVGVECETRWEFATSSEWVLFRCVAIDCNVVFGWVGKNAVTLDEGSYQFRPIRTKSERKRECSVNVICDILEVERDCGARSNLEKIYDAIGAGKIPGIRLTDE